MIIFRVVKHLVALVPSWRAAFEIQGLGILHFVSLDSFIFPVLAIHLLIKPKWLKQLLLKQIRIRYNTLLFPCLEENVNIIS